MSKKFFATIHDESVEIPYSYFPMMKMVMDYEGGFADFIVSKKAGALLKKLTYAAAMLGAIQSTNLSDATPGNVGFKVTELMYLARKYGKEKFEVTNSG